MNNFIEELSNNIWNDSLFKQEFKQIYLDSNTQKFNTKAKTNTDFASMKRLLECSTIFSLSESAIYREAAFKIIICAMSLFDNDILNMGEIAELVLTRIGNFPGKQLVKEKYDIRKYETIPKSLLIRMLKRETENSIKYKDKFIVLTDFQKKIWDLLIKGKSLSISAPTSAGKSFALQLYISRYYSEIKEKNINGVYLVPTRALINQVVETLNDLMNDQINVEIISIPTLPEKINKHVLYVLTQERLHLLYEAGQKEFDILIIDESQEVSSNSRGIILQTVIENIISSSPNIQLLFSSPLTSNPELFSQLFQKDLTEILEEECPVNQNVFFIDEIDGIYDEVSVGVRVNELKTDIGKIKLSNKVYFDRKLETIANISWDLGKKEKNIIYVNGKAECEKVALMICELNKLINKESNDQEIIDFSKFIKKHIYKDYLLASTIKQNIAFHYGNMPAILRKEVERLYENGKIDYLICTSTLLQGVNL